MLTPKGTGLDFLVLVGEPGFKTSFVPLGLFTSTAPESQANVKTHIIWDLCSPVGTPI